MRHVFTVSIGAGAARQRAPRWTCPYDGRQLRQQVALRARSRVVLFVSPRFLVWREIDLREPRRHAGKSTDRAGIAQLLNLERSGIALRAEPPVETIAASRLVNHLSCEARK
ncbi:hypothetical protein ACVIWU_003787 [Bradyrhizobium sp. USDA 4509]